MLHVMSCSSVEIIDAQDLIAALKQSFAQMRADKTGSAGDQNAALCQHELLLTAGRELRKPVGCYFDGVQAISALSGWRAFRKHGRQTIRAPGLFRYF